MYRADQNGFGTVDTSSKTGWAEYEHSTYFFSNGQIVRNQFISVDGKIIILMQMEKNLMVHSLLKVKTISQIKMELLLNKQMDGINQRMILGIILKMVMLFVMNS